MIFFADMHVCVYMYIKHIDTDDSVVIARGKAGWGTLEVGKGDKLGWKEI